MDRVGEILTQEASDIALTFYLYIYDEKNGKVTAKYLFYSLVFSLNSLSYLSLSFICVN